jgi:hypothetical protein
MTHRRRSKQEQAMKPSPETATPALLSVDVLRQLAAKVAALQAQARKVGVFPHDRELLACPRCGLMEDVSSHGQLLTCQLESLGEDTGLRFQEMASGDLRCPSCGAVVCAAPGD